MIEARRLKILFRRMSNAAERLREKYGRMHSIAVSARWCVWASRQ